MFKKTNYYLSKDRVEILVGYSILWYLLNMKIH